MSTKDAPCEPVKSATTLPLATASQRLRGRPGRPRTKPSGDNPGDSREPQRTQVRVPPARPAARTQDSPSCAPPGPRLLTRQQAADYLNLSSDMLDRLTQQGELPRVQLPLGNRNVRKVLYDRAAPDSYTPKHLAERILTSKAALEGERKQVTVLFADLKGSMELLADRDPEEARKLLDPVLERMMEAVHRYEGTVNQVMGDGIMALFGAPLAHEDHAVRACYAALRMQEAREAVRGRACAARRAWRSRSASASTPARSSCARSAATCAWTTPRSARRRTWRPAWSSSRRPGRSVLTRRDAAAGRGLRRRCRSLGPDPGEGARRSPSRSSS